MILSAEMKNHLDERGVKYMIMPSPESDLKQDVTHVSNDQIISIVRAAILNIDGHYAIMVLMTLETIDFERMKYLLGARSIRLATEVECQKLFPGCESSAIPILGNFYNVPVYCSSKLLEQHRITFNTGTHDETMIISIDDFIRMAKPTTGTFTKHV